MSAVAHATMRREKSMMMMCREWRESLEGKAAGDDGENEKKCMRSIWSRGFFFFFFFFAFPLEEEGGWHGDAAGMKEEEEGDDGRRHERQ